MTWVRYFSKKIFGPYLGKMSEDKAQKYMNISRILYFFSATSVAILVWDGYKTNKKTLLESGVPVIQDHSSGKL